MASNPIGFQYLEEPSTERRIPERSPLFRLKTTQGTERYGFDEKSKLFRHLITRVSICMYCCSEFFHMWSVPLAGSTKLEDNAQEAIQVPPTGQSNRTIWYPSIFFPWFLMTTFCFDPLASVAPCGWCSISLAGSLSLQKMPKSTRFYTSSLMKSFLEKYEWFGIRGKSTDYIDKFFRCFLLTGGSELDIFNSNEPKLLLELPGKEGKSTHDRKVDRWTMISSSYHLNSRRMEGISSANWYCPGLLKINT